MRVVLRTSLHPLVDAKIRLLAAWRNIIPFLSSPSAFSLVSPMKLTADAVAHKGYAVVPARVSPSMWENAPRCRNPNELGLGRCSVFLSDRLLGAKKHKSRTVSVVCVVWRRKFSRPAAGGSMICRLTLNASTGGVS